MPIRCPYCAFQRLWKIRRDKRKCKQCRREFSANEYPVEGFHVTTREWQLCINIFIRQRSTNAVVNESSLARCRTLKMVSHLRDLMSSDMPTSFHGPIELDETYIGGQRKNKKLHIRRIQAKKGHGTDKLPIVGIFDRETGKLVVRVEPKKLDIYFIISLLQTLTMRGTMIFTDGFKMYRMLPKYGFQHEYVDHDGGELVRGEIHTNNIEGFWGILKRSLGCIGGIRRSRLPIFVGELVWRFNHRNLSSQEQADCLMNLLLHTKFGGRN